MSSTGETFYMPAQQMDELAGSDVEGLKPVVEWAGDRRAFSIRDSFDHSLRLSRRLLLEDGERVELLSVSGAALTQNAVPGARFVADFDDGPVKEALSGLSPLRALLPVASGTARSGRLALVDDEGKTRARAVLRELQAAEGATVVLVTAQGLRGYDRALRDLVVRIRECGGTSLSAGNLYRMIDPACMPMIPSL